MSTFQDSFKTAVSYKDQVYGIPMGNAMGGGILYNKAVFAKLGLQVPKTWADFMANNAKIKAAGIDPVIQTFGDTWTSQLFVLADFHNVAAAQSDWAAKYTANQAKYVSQTSFNLLFANILVITIPMLIMYIVFNRQIVAGMTSGAVKG